jgi:putative pyruvate formate lyase activating enzyme
LIQKLICALGRHRHPCRLTGRSRCLLLAASPQRFQELNIVASFPPETEGRLKYRAGRAALAAGRVEAARGSLSCCQLCAHHCGVDRRFAAAGKCHAGANARVFSAQMEVSDELSIAPTFAIAFAGCDLRCAFCITGRESWNARAGEPLDVAALASRANASLRAGTRTVMILGGEPTIFLPDALALVAHLPDTATLVWKTNAHGSSAARTWLDGVFDVWIADYKFGNDQCASQLARVPAYTQVVQENLRWAAREHRLIVRHLLMPGHVECCWLPVATWMADALPDIEISLRDGFWPAWKSAEHGELRATCTRAEITRARSIAADFALRLIP